MHSLKAWILGLDEHLVSDDAPAGKLSERVAVLVLCLSNHAFEGIKPKKIRSSRCRAVQGKVSWTTYFVFRFDAVKIQRAHNSRTAILAARLQNMKECLA